MSRGPRLVRASASVFLWLAPTPKHMFLQAPLPVPSPYLQSASIPDVHRNYSLLLHVIQLLRFGVDESVHTFSHAS